ncbi:2-oxo-4-hydroxy-4-carboxy-5-ureidoimidazoline decarboxylase [soil metagenome]
MTVTVAPLDDMPDTAAATELTACCGSSAWVSGMLARRPFATTDVLLSAADEVADTLVENDWLEAFTHHPKIGARSANAAVSTTAKSWSAGEQSAVATADTTVMVALADANDAYEARYGFIFIVFANGRNASEILALLRTRMTNERSDEISIASAEQRKITRLRLGKLVMSGDTI